MLAAVFVRGMSEPDDNLLGMTGEKENNLGKDFLAKNL